MTLKELVDEVTIQAEVIKKADGLYPVYRTRSAPLTEEQIMGIIDLSMKDIEARLAERDITVKLTDESKALIAKEAYTPQYGARPVKRYLQKYIETGIAEKLIRGEITDGEAITIDAKGGKQEFTATAGE